MKWSMDTHKYMSEITRTALQVIAKHGITSESKPEEIDAVEKELVEKKVYKDYPSAKGRVRRALFTYFRAYGCLNDVEQLTEVGREFIANRLSVKELSFEYILNSDCRQNAFGLPFFPSWLSSLPVFSDSCRQT